LWGVENKWFLLTKPVAVNAVLLRLGYRATSEEGGSIFVSQLCISEA